MNAKVLRFPVKQTQTDDELIDLQDWDWEAFKDVFDAIAIAEGEEYAWKMIHTLWKMRAGELDGK